MPSITIKEQDLTKGGGSSDNLNIVYVPGCIGTSTGSETPAASVDTPVLCNTIDDFERYFGTSPANISATIDDNTTVIFDKSYVYAKELLDLGLPVLYEGIFNSTDGDITLEDITNKLAGATATDTTTTPPTTTVYDSPYDKLEDRGEYDFKYLTSGGYSNYVVPESGDEAVQITSLDEDGTVISLLLQATNLKKGNTSTYVFTCTNPTPTITEDDVPGTSNWEVKMKDGSNLIVPNSANNGYETPASTAFKLIPDGDGKYTMTHAVHGAQVLEVELKSTVKLTKGDIIEVTLSQEYSDDAAIDGTFKVETKHVIATATTNSPIVSKMVSVAYKRGDCILLIDHDDDKDMELIGDGSFHSSIVAEAKSLKASDCCAAFTPWVNINCSTYTPVDKSPVSMPPSFAYLAALANSLRTNASWVAIAGATRGQIPGLNGTEPLNINKVLTNSIAENQYQNRGTESGTTGISINAITNIKPFGYRIWGNRTLKDNTIAPGLTATSFLNTRSMICDIKKVAFNACRRLMFEQNNDVLWLNFKAAIEPTLEKMKSGAGLAGYKIVQIATTEKAKLIAQIKLYPLYAVEDFEITVQMLDDDIQVS